MEHLTIELIGLVVFTIFQTIVIVNMNYHFIKHKGTGLKIHNTWWHRFQYSSWVLFYGCISYVYFKPFSTLEFLEAGLFTLFLGLIHWNIFDPLLNIRRKLPLSHRGKNPIDKYLGHPVVKIALLVGVGILIYFKFR